MVKTISKIRWEKLRQRMIAYGIDDVPLTAIPLNITETAKQPEEAAARLLLLLSIAFSASNAAETDKIADWLKTEELWQAASEAEKTFFREHETNEERRAGLSFQFEGAYMLAWTLGEVKIYPDPSSECDLELVGDFFSVIPPLFSETDALFDNAQFRKTVAIHDEYLFYSMTQLYFKHIREVDKENTSNIHEAAAYQRFLVLEWLMSDADWDDLEEEE